MVQGIVLCRETLFRLPERVVNSEFVEFKAELRIEWIARHISAEISHRKNLLKLIIGLILNMNTAQNTERGSSFFYVLTIQKCNHFELFIVRI